MPKRLGRAYYKRIAAYSLDWRAVVAQCINRHYSENQMSLQKSCSDKAITRTSLSLVESNRQPRLVTVSTQ